MREITLLMINFNKIIMCWLLLLPVGNPKFFTPGLQIFRRVKEPPEVTLKTKLSAIDLVRFALPREEIDRLKKEFDDNPQKFEELIRMISRDEVKKGLNLSETEFLFLINEILKKYESYSSGQIEGLTGYKKQVFPALLYLWIDKGPFYKGAATVIFSYHNDEYDFSQTRGILEKIIQEARGGNFEIEFIDEYIGIDLATLRVVAKQEGIDVYSFLTDKKYKARLKEIFDQQTKARKEELEVVEKGEIPPNISAGSIFPEYEVALMKFLASHKIKTIPERVSFESWQNFMIHVYFYIEAQKAILSGDEEKYISDMKKNIGIIVGSIRKRDEDFREFLVERLRPNKKIISTRGITHKPQSETGKYYEIGFQYSYTPIYSPYDELVIKKTERKPLGHTEEDELLYEYIPFHVSWSVLEHHHSQMPLYRKIEVNRTVSSLWTKEKILTLLATFRDKGEIAGINYFIEEVLKHPQLNPEIKDLFRKKPKG